MKFESINKISPEEAYNTAVKIRNALSVEGPSYCSVLRDEDGNHKVLVTTEPLERPQPKAPIKIEDVVKNWPATWSDSFNPGDSIEAKVWENDAWTSQPVWLKGVVKSVNRFTGCVAVTVNGKTHYILSEGCIRKPTDMKGPTTAQPDQTAKQDLGKVNWGLLFPHVRKALEAVIAVRAYGATKYGDSESWRTVKKDRYLTAAMRHLVAALSGAVKNKEDGDCYHLAQAVTDLLFALELQLKEEK